MTTLYPSPLLRRALLADAAISGATGLLMLGGAHFLDGLLDLPAPLLRGAGLFLVPYGALVGFLGTRDTMPVAAVWAVILGNLAWAVESGLLALSGWVAPTPLGIVFILGQALVVAAFAILQYVGLHRPRRQLA